MVFPFQYSMPNQNQITWQVRDFKCFLMFFLGENICLCNDVFLYLRFVSFNSFCKSRSRSASFSWLGKASFILGYLCLALLIMVGHLPVPYFSAYHVVFMLFLWLSF